MKAAHDSCHCFVLIVVMVLPPMRAQNAARWTTRAADRGGRRRAERLDLMVGRSTVIRMDRPIARVSLSTPDIADAMVTTPYEVLVHGKMPGTISLLMWGDNGQITTYDVAVRRDLSSLEQPDETQFPGEAIKVAGNGKDVVLSGTVSSKYVVERAASLAVGYVDKAENVVNMLAAGHGPVTNQVLLRVRFAEVSRSAMQELGAGSSPARTAKATGWAAAPPSSIPAPDFDQDKGLVFSDFLNLFAFNTEEQHRRASSRRSRTKGLFQSLAEPNLITQDGKEASFLAGGEYPYPVIQGTGGNSAVTIVFKEFGVRLQFTPTMTADDMIHLKVAPEVSTLDFGNGRDAVRIPRAGALDAPHRDRSRAARRADIRDRRAAGQTVDETLRKVPGIGDIPILGYLFKSQAYKRTRPSWW